MVPMGNLDQTFGFSPQIPLPYDLQPVAQMISQWQWANPLAAILRFGGWTIDDAIDDPQVARAVRQLWKVWKDSKRHLAERQERFIVQELVHWRHEGLPVPCPFCRVKGPCTCPIPAIYL